MLKQCLNKDWSFSHDWTWRGREKWKKIDLPYDFMIGQQRHADSLTGRGGGYFPGGYGLYTKTLFAPEEWRDKDVFVEFEGIYMNAEIKLNRNVITRQNYGYTTFIVNLNKYLKYGEENELSVTVDNAAIPNSRWYSGSGIYRDVWLYVAEKLHIKHWGVCVKTTDVSASSAKISISTDIKGSAGSNVSVNNTFYDKNNSTVDGLTLLSQDVSTNTYTAVYKISNPDIWDIDSPNLYTVETSLYDGDKLSDAVKTVFGIRSFTLDAKNGFVLNSKPLKLKGGCVHHDNGILGAASYNRSEERKIELLKASGYNAVRTAHNPPSPSFLDACDRLGMLVMDEAFDQWRVEKTQYDYHINFDRDWKHDLTNMILRDRNHPSIMFWSIGNEIVEQYGGSSAVETSAMLAGAIRELDDRPITMGLHPCDEKFDEDIAKVVAPLDFVGYNYEYKRYESIRNKYPDRVIAGTETVPKEIYDSWEMTLKYPNVIGDFVWTSLDYLGEAGLGRVYYTEERPEIERHLSDYPWVQAYCGDIDVCGFKRPQSYYRDILWGVSDKPKMFARRSSEYSKEFERVTFWGWNDCIEGWDFGGWEDKPVTVDVYTPAKSVSLYLNDVLVDTKETAKLKAEFDLTYTPGILKAVDSNNNEVVLSTSKAPYQIKLTPDRTTIGADADLCYVTVEITDFNGKTVTDATNKVMFAVTGAGNLLAVGSSNPVTEECFTGPSQSAYDGKLMAVVKSNASGSITLHAIAEGLMPGQIEILAK